MKKPINSPSADERRQGKDAGVRFLELASIGGWIMFIIASIIFHFARPELQTGVQRFWGIETRAEWNATLLPYLQGLLAICVLLSLAGTVLRRVRARRATDSSWSNVVFLLFAAGSGLMLIWMAR